MFEFDYPKKFNRAPKPLASRVDNRSDRVRVGELLNSLPNRIFLSEQFVSSPSVRSSN